MANLIAGLIEVLEQEHRLGVARNPSQRPAIRIPAADVAATIRPSGYLEYVIPIEKLIQRLKEQLPKA